MLRKISEERRQKEVKGQESVRTRRLSVELDHKIKITTRIVE